VIRAVGDWIEKNPELVKTLVVVTGVFTGLVAVVGALGVAIGAVVLGFGSMALPIILIIAIVSVLIGAFVALQVKFGGVKEFMLAAWDELKIRTQNVLEKTQDIFVGVFTAIKEFFIDVWDAMLDKVENWVDSVTEFLQPVVDMVNRIQSGIGSGIDAVGDRVSRGLSNIGSFIGIDDAVITPQGQVIKTNPADYLFATKNPDSMRGGVTVNIQGGTFLSEEAAEEMGDIFINKLKMSKKL
jgi:phage-related protein